MNPGDGLQLVQRAAGVAEPAAGGLRHRGAARHHDGHQRDGDLVADAAGGVLVHQRQWLAVAAQVGEVEPLAGVDHRRRPAGDLVAVIPRRKIAISSADICSSSTPPWV